MAHVIAEPCIDVKDIACVDACPVDCIHPRKDDGDFGSRNMLYINPIECIDCGACVPVCPVSAIFVEDDLPPKMGKVRADQCGPLFRTGNRHRNNALAQQTITLRYAGSGRGLSE
jgi:NAD-dependent dihydropyrimidine dehydrogenase PreA subunit